VDSYKLVGDGTPTIGEEEEKLVGDETPTKGEFRAAEPIFFQQQDAN